MKLLGYNKVLCISPHPDDVEYSMGGTIRKFMDTDFDILTLSHGTSSDPTSSKNRLLEVNQFWEIMRYGVNLINIGDSFESKTQGEWVKSIESQIDITTYDAIFTTSDFDSHYEHKITNQISLALTRSCGVDLIEYKSPSTLHSWIPNMFVDVSFELPTKIRALRTSFSSQIDAEYFSEKNIKLFNSDYISSKKGTGYLEQFKVIMKYIN